MNHDQYTSLESHHIADALISASDLTDKTDRTLLYGYTADRDTHHVYVQDGVIHRLIYDNIQSKVLEHDSGSLKAATIAPFKRLYPERCDFEFCQMLKNRGVYLSFTNFDSSWLKGQVLFVGHTHEDF